MRFLLRVQWCPATLAKPRFLLCFKVGRVCDECFFSWCIFLQDFKKVSEECIKLLIYWIGWENLIPNCSHHVKLELIKIVVFLSCVTLILIHCFIVTTSSETATCPKRPEDKRMSVTYWELISLSVIILSNKEEVVLEIRVICFVLAGCKMNGFRTQFIFICSVGDRQSILNSPMIVMFDFSVRYMSIAMFNDSKNNFLCFCRIFWITPTIWFFRFLAINSIDMFSLRFPSNDLQTPFHVLIFLIMSEPSASPRHLSP